MSTESTAIIGGGITGLTAAYRLALENREVRLFESSARTGGSIHSARSPAGWLHETGPNALLLKTRELSELITRLGLDAQRQIPAPGAAKRFLVRDGRLLALPTSPFSAIGTRLFSRKLKLRIVRDFLFARPKKRDADLPLAQLAREHYGDEFVTYGLNPLVAGVYAGDPEKLSARLAMPFIWEAERTHGSIIRGQLAQMRARRAAGAPKSTLLSFPDGLQTLAAALAAQLPRSAIETEARVESIARVNAPAAGEPRWQVRWIARDGLARTEIFSKILLALPAAALARLQISPVPAPASASGRAPEMDTRTKSKTESPAQPPVFFTPLAPLSEIEYPPVASLFLGYRRGQVAHPLDGFGLLVPGIEKLPFLGVLFSSSLFPGRAPAGHVALTVMLGGTRQPGLAALPEAQLVDLVSPSLAKLLGIEGAPVFRSLAAHPHAIPQYNVGYERHLALMDEFEQAHPGIVIAGHVRDGIAVPACIASGEMRARQV